MDRFLTQVKAAGFAGVQNFPTVGLFDGAFRANLEETNFGYDKERLPTERAIRKQTERLTQMRKD
jgi:predicted TIM-barrel enzyme